MHIWLAFRRVTARDLERSRLVRWTIQYTQPPAGAACIDPVVPDGAPVDICHVEIIVPVRCSQTPSCIYCQHLRSQQRLMPEQVNHTRVTQHRLSFSVTNEPGQDTVFYHVNRVYPTVWDTQSQGRAEWWFLRCDAVTTSEWKQIKNFLMQQLGKPFAARAFYANFAPLVWRSGWCRRTVTKVPASPSPRLSWWQYGCDYRADLQYHTHDRWFCSELGTAAVQVLGVLPQVAPATVTPNYLFWTLCNSARWTVFRELPSVENSTITPTSHPLTSIRYEF